MATARLDAIEGIFDDHPSLSASLEDFEHNADNSEANRSPLFNLPSHHSGFLSEDAESEVAESDSGRPWSPPAWKRHSGIGAGPSGWFRQQSMLRERLAGASGSSPRGSRETSPQYDSAQEDLTIPANIRLPTDSPLKRSPSPEPYPNQGTDFAKSFGGRAENQAAKVEDNPNNYIRFAMRAEVQHRTEPFEAAFAYVRDSFSQITKSRSSTFLTILIALMSTTVLRVLFQTPAPTPVPDLVKVAGLAKAFEPLIFYSENGVQQIGDLQETGVAVWDLGESVRSTNMTSAPIIVRELDELSDSLKTLAIELTKFFANVDGDVDGILIVMEWAKRELSALSNLPPSPLSSLFSNTHSLLSRLNLLETPSGTSTTLGATITTLFGQSHPQRTRKTLQRTFNEFLAVLEESISNELTHSTALFTLFSAIDQQFLNLARTVIRESDHQEHMESELLSSLWTRVLGPNASALRKYSRNLQLLSNVRQKTITNKHLLVDHNGKLLTLKANLETLRKKLVSPLVKGEGSTLSVEEQIGGLEGVYSHLRGVRERQKGKMMEMIYGAGKRRIGLGMAADGAIEGSM